MTQPNMSESGQAKTIKKLFSRQTSVAIDIAASLEKI